jgi:hypothetical protein
LQPIQRFFTPTKNLQTNLFDIKVEEESISHEDSSVAPERIDTIKNPLFEIVEQQPLQ